LYVSGPSKAADGGRGRGGGRKEKKRKERTVRQKSQVRPPLLRWRLEEKKEKKKKGKRGGGEGSRACHANSPLEDHASALAKEKGGRKGRRGLDPVITSYGEAGSIWKKERRKKEKGGLEQHALKLYLFGETSRPSQSLERRVERDGTTSFSSTILSTGEEVFFSRRPTGKERRKKKEEAS